MENNKGLETNLSKEKEDISQREKNIWKDIHPSFAWKTQGDKNLQQEWEEIDITYEEAKEWIKLGFFPYEINDIKNWKKLGLSAQDVQRSIKSNLSAEEIKLLWEKAGLTCQDAWEWIYAEFKPDDHYLIKGWKNLSFTPQQAKSWIDVGIHKSHYKFAAYLREKGYQPSSDLNLERLGTQFTQNYLDENYPKGQRNTITELDISKKNLVSSLDLSDFVNLEKLYCSENKLTSLKLDNCLKLKKLYCYNNQLTELKVNKLTELTELGCSDNQLTELNLPNPNQIWWINIRNNYLQDLSFLSALSGEKLTGTLSIYNNNFPEQDLSAFSRFVNLKELYIDNNNEEKIKKNIYNRFYGSLEPLKNFSKLEKLSISNTDIDSGLEYLPDNIKNFYCLTYKRPQAKVKIIEKELKEFGEPQLENSFWDHNFAKILQIWKKNYNSTQKCLDENYGRWARSFITNLDLSNKNLEGELSLAEFTSLKEINISGNPKLKKIKNLMGEEGILLKNDKQTIILTKGSEYINPRNVTNIQEYLSSQFPTWKDKMAVKEIDIYRINQKKGDWGITEKLKGGKLDLSDYPNLEKIEVDGNYYLKTKLTELKLGNKPKLTKLHCFDNKLTSLDLTNCPSLENVNCNQNQLSSLKFGNYPKLKELYCFDNKLSNLDLSNSSHLEKLDLSQNQVISLNIKNCSQLKDLKCYDNPVANSNLISFNKYPSLKGNFWWTLDAQEWLDTNYPQQERENITELNIRSKNLKGSLFLEDFVNLEELDCSSNKLAELEIIDCPNLTDLKCSWNKITDLNVSELAELETLNCSNNKLSDLDLSNSLQLIKLDCSENELTELDLTNCSNLRKLSCGQNYLTNFPNGLNSEKLEDLDITDNNFPEQDLSCFSKFENLEKLSIGNWEWHDKEEDEESEIYNHFTGSLEPLKNLTKLKTLDISHTDIDSGLEYLPETLEYFECISDERPESKVEEINDELIEFWEEDDWELEGGSLPRLRKWKKEWKLNNLDGKIRELTEQVDKLQSENTELMNKNKEKVNELKARRDFLEEKVEWIETELQKQVDLNRNQKKKLEKQTQESKELLNQNQKEKEDFQAKLTKKENWVQKLTGELADLQKYSTDLLEHSEQLEKELADTEKQSQAQQEELIILRQEVANKDAKLTSWQNKYQQDLQIQQLTLHNLEEEKTDLEIKLKSIQQEAINLQGKVKDIQKELKTGEDNCQKIAAELDEKKAKLLSSDFAEEELSKAKAEIEKLEKDLTQTKNKLRDKQSESLCLKKKLLDKEKELKRLHTEKQIEIDSLQIEKEKLQVDLNDLKTKLENNLKEFETNKQELVNTRKRLEEQLVSEKSIELTKSLRKREEKLKDESEHLKKEKQNLQESEKRLENELEKLLKQEKIFQKQIARAKSDAQRIAIESKLETVREQIETKLLISNPETQNLVVQTEVKNNFKQ